MRSSPNFPLLSLILSAGALLSTSATVGAGMQPEQAGDPPTPAGESVAIPPVEIPSAPAHEKLARPRPITFELRARGELGFNADLRDEPGDITVSRVGTGLGIVIPVRQFAQVDVGLDYEFSHYSFSDATTFAPGFDEPWERIHRETLSLRFSQQQSLRLGWFVGGSVGFAHEEGASLSDSLTGAAYAGVRYAMAENFFLGAGIAVRSRLEESPLVLPLPGFDWRITEQLRLTTANQLGLTLAYSVNEELTFSFGGRYETREFRLRDDGPTPDGVGRDRRVPIAAGIAYSPTPRLKLEFASGAYLWQQFRLSDSDGNTITEIDAKPTPFGGLQVSYRF